ncbi:hypothetical protein PENTCL1PPCAC_29109, partial [Pristionchus entomophagus]
CFEKRELLHDCSNIHLLSIFPACVVVLDELPLQFFVWASRVVQVFYPCPFIEVIGDIEQFIVSIRILVVDEKQPDAIYKSRFISTSILFRSCFVNEDIVNEQIIMTEDNARVESLDLFLEVIREISEIHRSEFLLESRLILPELWPKIIDELVHLWEGAGHSSDRQLVHARHHFRYGFLYFWPLQLMELQRFSRQELADDPVVKASDDLRGEPDCGKLLPLLELLFPVNDPIRSMSEHTIHQSILSIFFVEDGEDLVCDAIRKHLSFQLINSPVFSDGAREDAGDVLAGCDVLNWERNVEDFY